jgi:ribonucleotide monophosphatase NagD (HAD superfamily)
MAFELDMSSVLALTGVTTLEDLSRSEVRPDFVIRSLSELIPTRMDRP